MSSPPKTKTAYPTQFMQLTKTVLVINNKTRDDDACQEWSTIICERMYKNAVTVTQQFKDQSPPATGTLQ